ncbi:polysaccharide deacetylase family protein [Bryobacter aggregatus]|uniref:polysaccharide deacetylase family protein n=1 Tax=Bryobacter aggregatus TaxID=360054 RepID=UPI0004E1979A|nr:polysaccharide deacetylase family protein [Bryobacter aggregatus]
MKAALKRGLIGGLEAFGIHSLLPRLGEPRLLIPCYHGVVSEARPTAREGYEITVSCDEFAQHLEWLGRHYRFVDLAGALYWIENPSGGKPPVLISFDDGYRNNLTLAAPILRRYGAPAIFFLSTHYIGGNRLLWPLEMDVRLEQSPGLAIPVGEQQRRIPAEPRSRAALAFELRQIYKKLPNAERLAALERFRAATHFDPSQIDHELHDFLSWDEARQLAALGFEIGSHTCEHPILSRLDEDELRQELQNSKDKLEAELGRPVTSLAYPNGGAADYSPQVVEMAKSCGYRTAFAVDEAFQKPKTARPYALSRIIVQGHWPQSQFHFLASGARNLLSGRGF